MTLVRLKRCAVTSKCALNTMHTHSLVRSLKKKHSLSFPLLSAPFFSFSFLLPLPLLSIRHPLNSTISCLSWHQTPSSSSLSETSSKQFPSQSPEYTTGLLIFNFGRLLTSLGLSSGTTLEPYVRRCQFKNTDYDNRGRHYF